MFLANLQILINILEIFTNLVNNTLQACYTIKDDTSNEILKYSFPEAQIKQVNFLLDNKFPDKFHFGVSSTAYQCEDAWNINDKGESVWDYTKHVYPNLIPDQANGDISSDFYHMYTYDIQLANNIGATMMRISLSWSKILPNGNSNQVSQSGILFYSQVIDEMLINNITPMISLSDDDMPYPLQQLGGWANPIIVDFFLDYAKVVFVLFADKVQYWTTMNDAAKMCRYGYGGFEIPAINMSGIADYLCGHHVLLAHSKVYKLYHQKYNWQGEGKLGILNCYTWFVPEQNSSELDVAAAERAHIFYNDWLTYPIFSETVFTPSEIEDLKGSADFLGINYYTATSVEDFLYDKEAISFDKDAGIRKVETNRWLGETKIKNTPWALTKLLHRLHNDYSLPELWITGNGYADFGGILDLGRVVYLREHVKAILKAMQDGINIQGYLVKSLTDGFEKMDRYQMKFGLFQVDFNDSNHTRTPKLSAIVMDDIFETRRIRPLKEIYKKFQEELDIIRITEIIEEWIANIYYLSY